MEIFYELLDDARANDAIANILTDEDKAAIFDALLVTKTSTDFVIEIITKEGNESIYADVKKYFTDTLTQAELIATDTKAP